ncbi:hypothetical protein PUN28_011463 [Cardiocondyla obscurior]|uniref:Uncharacterized protein n=1 Tax=Cardiocondyla obscurior TaxID=286306 RepID=A0AAW2FE72_9HYME
MHGCDAIGRPVERSINLSNRQHFAPQSRHRVPRRPDSTSCPGPLPRRAFSRRARPFTPPADPRSIIEPRRAPRGTGKIRGRLSSSAGDPRGFGMWHSRRRDLPAAADVARARDQSKRSALRLP